MEQPLVSVIMGVFNQWDEKVLKESVDSILNQTYSKLEFIIWDDGSSPDAAKLIQNLNGLDKRIIVAGKEENRGLAYSLNECIRLAKGKYIARMDADDISKPLRIEKQVAFLETHPEYGWCGTDAELFDENGVWGLRAMPELPALKDYFYYSPYIHPSVMFRSELFDENLGYLASEETLRCEDYEIFMNLAKRGQKGYNLKEALFCYRETRESYKKRKFKFRLNEAKLRYRNYKEMGILFPLGWIYVFRPLAACLIPSPLLVLIKRHEGSRLKRLERLKILREQEKYQRRLEQYRSSLKKTPLHMQTVDSCMKRRNPDSTGYQTVREEIFLHVWLPVLTEYVEWVLEEAIKAGKKRLYFLARDGYMMYLLAEKFVRARKLKMELRYLKVSRFAIRSAEYYFVGKDALDTLCVGGIDITFEKIMKRARLTEEEALHIARLAGRTATYKTPLNNRQLQKLKEDLSRIEQLFFYIKKHSKSCYETTAAYLRQEGLLEKIPYALVDSGWIGTMQFSLQRVLAHETSSDVRLQGYYFGSYERPKGTAAEQYKAFYFGEKQVRRKVRFSNCLFETVFSAPEGMTCGYERTSDGTMHNEIHSQASVYVALESEIKNPNSEVMESFVKLLSEYASVYMEAAYETSTENEATAAEIVSDNLSAIHRSHAKRVHFVASLLEPMMGNPTRQEAKAFGELLFCDDILEAQLQPVAAKWDKEQLRENRFLNKLLSKLNLKSAPLHESAWTEGSIARLGIKPQANIRQERLYKRLMYFRKAVHR